MPSLEELLAEVKAEEGVDRIDADTSRLRAQFSAPSKETPAEARKADVDFLTSIDPTNPANIGNIAHHGIPMAIQMAATLYGGPSAGMLPRVARGALGSLGGYLYSSAAEPTLKGEPVTTTPEMAFLNLLLGGGSEVAVGGVGGATRAISGKAGLQREGAAAESQALDDILSTRKKADLAQTARRSAVAQKAEQGAVADLEKYDLTRSGAMLEQQAKIADIGEATRAKALKAQTEAEQRVLTQKEVLDRLRLKHSDAAFSSVKSEAVEGAVEQQVRDFLGAPSPLENPTIESLSARAAPVRESVERNVPKIFRNISARFQEKLAPYYKMPVQGNFAAAVDAERSLLEANKDVVSPTMRRVMEEVEGLDSGGGFNVASLPPMFRSEYERVAKTLPKEQAQAYIEKVARGAGITPASAAITDVEAVDKVRQKLTGVVIGKGSPIEKRVANRLISALDEGLEKALPEEVRADWANLRRDWREANSVFSSKFRSSLFRADTPAAVAETLYGASSGKQAHRVLTVIGQTPADELPLLRSAFAERLTRGDAVKNVEGLNPQVWKALYGKSGFATPQEFVEATRQNLAEKFDLPRVMADPDLKARFDARYQEGLRSYGVKRYEAALAKAEDTLRRTPDPAQVMREAMAGELTPQQAADLKVQGQAPVSPDVARDQALAAEFTPAQAGSQAVAGLERPYEARLRGEYEGMKTPMFGKTFNNWLEHHTGWKVAIALGSLGTAAGGVFTSHPMIAALPLAYVGSSRAAAAALSKPHIAKLWHSALTSKNAEQAAFFLGRLSAAALTEGTRSELE